ncbi:galactosyltransferase-related protein [uncultured Thiodictyon sp.]|uniref:galactosyltransferase-related protein n=1 Tax=uncultured Thiodictyon sp. TaxID=1846217 RepID=UPI00260040A0|nr:galactosyltransferase-related protein [uncultured Thiodictyon sp.]
MSAPTLRQQLGCWAHERWKTELILRAPSIAARLGLTWLDLHNRRESISRVDAGRARVCNWHDSSLFTACRLFPAIGGRLLRHCLKEWPVAFRDGLTAPDGRPDVSIIIPFRGTARLPQLRCCLANLCAQQGVAVEIILVEQSWEPLLADAVLPGVRYLHTQCVTPDMPFNRSWAMNVGARHALGDCLIFHDGDLLAPATYAATALDLMRRGYHGARLPRLIFYLDQDTSAPIQAENAMPATDMRIGEVRANCRATLVMDRQAYWRIGGHDESFSGWGGEDDELLERAATLHFYPGAFLPFIHLWHPSQPEKHSGMIEREQFTAQKLKIPVAQRIASLRDNSPGECSGPCRETARI